MTSLPLGSKDRPQIPHHWRRLIWGVPPGLGACPLRPAPCPLPSAPPCPPPSAVLCPLSALCPPPSALCLLLSALCPLPSALCPLPPAALLCSLLPWSATSSDPCRVRGAGCLMANHAFRRVAGTGREDPQPDANPSRQCLVVQCGCFCVGQRKEAKSKKTPLEGGLGGEP